MARPTLLLVLVGTLILLAPGTQAAWGTPQDAPTPTQPAVVDTPPAAPEPVAAAAAAARTPAAASSTTHKPPNDGRLEKFGLAAVALFLANVWAGRRRNAALAAAVSDAITPVLRRHFAHVGPGAPPARVEEEAAADAGAAAPVLVRHGPDAFTIPASGRRGLGMAALTIKTRPRHDMLGLALALLDPSASRDTLEVVASLPAGLHPAVLVAGRPAALRAAAGPIADGGSADVAHLTCPVSTAHARSGGGGRWPPGIVGAADQPAAWLQVVGGGPLGDALSTDAAAAHALISFKASTDGWGGSARALSATIALPPNAGAASPRADLSHVAALVDAVLATADALAAYRPGPDAVAKAAKVRAEAEARVDRAKRRAATAEDAAAERRAARQAAEAERLARMAPDAREKALARKKRIEEKRALAKRTKRI